jgi:hypothetical protein
MKNVQDTHVVSSSVGASGGIPHRPDAFADILASHLKAEIVAAQKAYASTLEFGHADCLERYQRLAELLRTHYDQHNDLASLRELVTLQKDVLRIAPKDESLRAEYHLNSASLFVRLRSQDTVDEEKLDEHINRIRTVIEVNPSDYRYHTALSTLTIYRAEVGVDLSLPHEAILYQRQALSHAPTDLLLVDVGHAVDSVNLAEGV